MNQKENWLRLIHNDNPGWIGLPWEGFKGNFIRDVFITDPISASVRGGGRIFDTVYKDAWGTSWLWRTGTPAAMVWITEENKVLRDVTKWRDVVKFPELDGHDWTPYKAFVDSVDRSENMIIPFVTSGLFERSHALMGFEDALCSYIEEPEEMYEMIGAIADWKIGQLERICTHLKPDAVFFHDDWGAKTTLFLPPDLWRKIIKPHHKRIVDCVKSFGSLFIHHSDTYCEPIAEDMAEIGIDVWQGAVPQNDIVSIQKKLNGRMAIMGGIDAQLIDMPEANEEIIRGEVRRCIDTYCPQGCFIPCITNGFPIYPAVEKIYNDELINYGQNYF